MSDLAGLLGQVALVAGQTLLPMGAKLGMGGRHLIARPAEQRAEADTVLPERLALGVAQPPDEELVEALGRVGECSLVPT